MKQLIYEVTGNTGSMARVNVGKKYYAEADLYRDYHREGDGIFWLMQKAVCIKAHYTERDIFLQELYDRATLIENRDIVEIVTLDSEEMRLIDRKLYRAKVTGDYSDCCIFEEV